jgi:hypothetical protein
MRLPWQKHDDNVDPSRPHEFRSKTDSGIAALAPIGGGIGQQAADIAMTSAYTRTTGCAVPGCGKPPDALIHAPEE